MKYRTNVFLLFVLSAGNVSAECLHERWIEYEGDQLLKNVAAEYYSFQTERVSIDADGAPNAYHPENIGLDYLANAGYPDKSWWPSVIVKDPENPDKGYVQTNGDFVGYFVSKTSLQDNSKPEIEPSRYVDATKIPYLVFPRTFYKLKGTGLLGDLGFALNTSTGESSVFVVADVGPSSKPMGEMSVKLAENLGGKNVSARNGSGVAPGSTRYVIFPYSSKTYSWPLSVKEIETAISVLMSLSTDLEHLDNCY